MIVHVRVYVMLSLTALASDCYSEPVTGDCHAICDTVMAGYGVN